MVVILSSEMALKSVSECDVMCALSPHSSCSFFRQCYILYTVHEPHFQKDKPRVPYCACFGTSCWGEELLFHSQNTIRWLAYPYAWCIQVTAHFTYKHYRLFLYLHSSVIYTACMEEENAARPVQSQEQYARTVESGYEVHIIAYQVHAVFLTKALFAAARMEIAISSFCGNFCSSFKCLRSN